MSHEVKPARFRRQAGMSAVPRTGHSPEAEDATSQRKSVKRIIRADITVNRCSINYPGRCIATKLEDKYLRDG